MWNSSNLSSSVTQSEKSGIQGKQYENMPMQYAEIFFYCKNWKIHKKIFYIFLIFAQNMDCGYTLEPPRRGGSNEYPQSMFWSKNKKK